MDLLSSLKPNDNSAKSHPSSTSDSRIRNTMEKCSFLMSFPLQPHPASLTCQQTICPISLLPHLPQFSNYLTLFTHSSLWNSVSCCLRGTFPRLFLCLSARSSFYFLAFTPFLTQQRVSILSWLFSWAYSVSLAILSTCAHHLSLVPDGSQVQCCISWYPKYLSTWTSCWHLRINCLHLKLLTFLTSIFAVHWGHNALPPRFHLVSNSNFHPSYSGAWSCILIFSWLSFESAPAWEITWPSWLSFFFLSFAYSFIIAF